MINADEIVAELPKAKLDLATRRTLNALGLPYTESKDGMIHVGEQLSTDSELRERFVEEWTEQIKLVAVVYVQEKAERLGVLVRDGVNEDGTIRYKPAPGL